MTGISVVDNACNVFRDRKSFKIQGAICAHKKPEDNVAISNPRITPVPKGKNLLRSDLKLDNQTKN